MGRRKRRPSASTKKEEIPEDAADIFLGLSDLCGGEKNERHQLIESLHRFSLALYENASQKTDSCLLQVEDAATTVRERMELFQPSNDRSEVIYLRQELEAISREQDMDISWIYFARYLAASIEMATQQEEKTCQDLLRLLDGLYEDDRYAKDSGDETHRLRQKMDQIQHIVDRLKRKELIEQPQFQEGLSIIRRLYEDETSIESRRNERLDYTPEEKPTRIAMSCHAEAPAVAGASTLWEALDVFLALSSGDEPSVHSLLLVGPEGSGKTYTCDKIERIAKDSVVVIRPSIPLDLLGKSVGEMEDTIISIFGACNRHSGHTIIILDDLEHLLVANEPVLDNSVSAKVYIRESHVKCRSQAILLAMMDELWKLCEPGSHILVIGTSRTDVASQISRFDQTFQLQPPNEEERKHLLLSLLGLLEAAQDTTSPQGRALNATLSNVVESTVGRSYSELTLYCRQAVEMMVEAGADTDLALLQCLQRRLQSVMPESLQSGAVDDFVDMRVLTAKDLLDTMELREEGGQPCRLPLYGSSVDKAWEELQSSIIIPLCRGQQLASLLDSTESRDPSVVTGGLMLTGLPGTGKSEIAYHCGKYAATLLQSVKLLDVSCTSLIHKEVGGSERAIHHLFDCARRAAPCILVMDGIENIAAVRGNDPTTEGTLDRVLSTLLVELDGIDEQHSSEHEGGIAVIGITHNVDWIDPALMRPGRLEKVVELRLPDAATRYRIFCREMGLSGGQEDPAVTVCMLEQAANETDGMTAASIVAICNDMKVLLARTGNISLQNIQAMIEARY